MKGRPRARRVNIIVPALLLTAVAVFPRASEAGQACTYTVNLSGLGTVIDWWTIGGESFVYLDTQPGCPYTVESSEPFVTPDVTSGVGEDVIHNYIWFTVAPNFTSSNRTATLRIADQSVPIMQLRGNPLGDVDRDGFADLVWHHRGDGRLAAWLMNRTQRIEAVGFSLSQVADTDWVLAGAGDLDGDGNIDLVWRHADGRVAAWLMDRLQLREATLLSIPVVADADWRIQAVADMDSDGRADILWQHKSLGTVGVWFMNGLQVLAAEPVNGPVVADPNWRLVGLGVGVVTFATVLVWQNDADGRIGVWLISGLNVGSTEIYSSVPDPNWKLRALADLDRNGASDFIWQHAVDGRLGVWRDGNPMRTVELGTVADANWHIIGPR